MALNAPEAVGEFALIARMLRDARAVAAGPGIAYGAGGDTALLHARTLRKNGLIAVTVDTLAEGVHLPAGAPWPWFGERAAEAALSDLAAAGARPWAVLSQIAFPPGRAADVLAVNRGLVAALRRHGATLVGGNLTTVPGPLAVTLTALGICPPGRALRRDAARAGDLIAVTGTIGDGALGCRTALARGLPARRPARGPLAHYLLPRARIAEGEALAAVGVKAATDVSDGLLQDVTHMCEAAGLRARIALDGIPVSPAYRAAMGAGSPTALELAVTGGDDYELVFALPPRLRRPLATRWRRGKRLAPYQVIGQFTPGRPGLDLLWRGQPASWWPSHLGYDHGGSGTRPVPA